MSRACLFLRLNDFIMLFVNKNFKGFSLAALIEFANLIQLVYIFLGGLKADYFLFLFIHASKGNK